MADKRRSLEQRINDRVAKIKEAQEELERLQAIQTKAEQLGIHGDNDNAVWAQVKQRYATQ